MGKDQLGRVVAQRQYKNYIAPIDDETYGRELYFNGYGWQHCQNEAQRDAYAKASAEASRWLASEWLVADMAQIAA